jgi:hypothetical protein
MHLIQENIMQKPIARKTMIRLVIAFGSAAAASGGHGGGGHGIICSEP